MQGEFVYFVNMKHFFANRTNSPSIILTFAYPNHLTTYASMQPMQRKIKIHTRAYVSYKK